jgi:hypothetical protein
MSKFFVVALLAVVAAAAAAAVPGESAVAEEAVRMYNYHTPPKCYIKYKKCCDEPKYETCTHHKCRKYYYCPKKHGKSTYRAAEGNSAASGEVDSSVKTYGDLDPSAKNYGCYWKEHCYDEHYKCQKGTYTKCYEEKQKHCDEHSCDY